ncbi:hypothetical protein IAR55_003565 [Kwoniella newhampshirensis]|uniref:Iron-sulfur assembly protein 1 n=1 Tax=Kwoniella newhampshirensis TaxID=1651941 RepID=A0AAW0YNY1_9TREE
MAIPALRTSFASSSRLTLHHFPSSSYILPAPFARFGSSLAQTVPAQSGFEGIPSAAYAGRVEQQSSSSATKLTRGKEALSHVAPSPSSTTSGAGTATKKTGEKRKVELKSKKSAITMTPAAISHLRNLLASPTEPRLLRISVKSRGCAGMAYHLDYVPPPGGRFDEVVEQDGVKVLIDSKALFSIIGSRMDWRDNRLSAGFVFDNPNVVDTCGCGESFNIRI